MIRLLFEFFKTGLFAVGGGLATLPFLEEMARKYPWFSQEELLDMIAVSESTPGPIGINMATFAGFKASGVIGGIAAPLALILPSFVIILLIGTFYDRYRNLTAVDTAFQGIRPCTAGLILGAMAPVFRLTFFEEGLSAGPVILFLFFLFLKFRRPKTSPILLIVLGGLFGGILGL